MLFICEDPVVVRLFNITGTLWSAPTRFVNSNKVFDSVAISSKPIHPVLSCPSIRTKFKTAVMSNKIIYLHKIIMAKYMFLI